MSEQKPGFIRRLLHSVWQGFRFIRNFVLNFVFALLFIGFIAVLFSDKAQVEVNDKTALVLNLKGDLVEEKQWVDPVEKAINESTGSEEDRPEILVRDLVKVINEAAKDDRVKVMVLALADLGSGSLDKLQQIGGALETFKAAGKKVFATGAYYSQNQYFLASYADSINLNPMGAVILEGYGSYPMYYKAALEKLQISTHVFKVGTYKSAVEPFTRNDMSPEAKEANGVWLTELWQNYKEQVAARRGFAVDNFDESFARLYDRINAANGDMTQYALDAKLVDTIKTREEFRQDIIALVGEDEDNHTFKQISYEDYQSLVIPPFPVVNPLTDKVALVVARGAIVDGNVKAGMIGGESTAKLLRTARYDDKVKAVVLRIDSGGGSAFASEQIAQEIRLLKAAGKPVIASMGAVAASGGYWIAAPADQIFAAPTTITGSIGIFALFHTAENAMTTLGLNVDGVGTTELAGFSSGLPLFKGLPADAEKLLQRSIENGYDEFITHVSTTRNIDKVQVDKIAQGRVWTGQTALKLGLVDKLGTLDDAIAAAAATASLKHFDVQLIEQEMTEQEKLMAQLFGSAKMLGLLPEQAVTMTPVQKLMQQLNQELQVLGQFNDPNGIYSVCFACQVQ
ncbi:signal peptide peptidase SppA [Rheinheimera sp. F8]|uniref:signal peptide peptidase SppA n=1 Tax=Rheinheimera sp. F8 TaxID=1763998 RepID=UPI000744D149|nr:signal peptide peptidase SppA [Rheinheimera sp. F8]ALZ76953.1 signal peptide peptidase SppA [Rheinheimera sp. F8]